MPPLPGQAGIDPSTLPPPIRDELLAPDPVAIDTAANVWPLVPPNRSNSDMLDDVAAEAPAIATPSPLPQPASVQEA